MNTFQITASALEGYKNAKISDERINFLIAQANEQLDEISQNQEMYSTWLEEVDAPPKIDNIILWILFMSNEDICIDYINAFHKDFRKIIPISDLSDFLFYVIYLQKIKDITLDGFEYLSEYEEDGLEDVDQYSLTNTFLHIQQSKEITFEF
ncbi:MAG: hypothetical protein Q9M36_02560 [Sulfurovum sp.]|nr:hypothetical protein [Sulfurovum sp.]